MKKFLKAVLILIGIGAVFYLLTHKKDEAGQVWRDILAKVPGGGCCSSGKSDAEADAEADPE
jgi:hypothetical protein